MRLLCCPMSKPQDYRSVLTPPVRSVHPTAMKIASARRAVACRERRRSGIVASFRSLFRLGEIFLQVFRVGRRLVLLDRHHVALGVEEIELAPDRDPAIVLGAIVFFVDRIG